MPLAPINVDSSSGLQNLTLTWDRPLDASIVSFLVSWGYASGLYTFSENVGNVREYSIVVPAGQSVYAIVQSVDSTPTLSDPSEEQSRVFPIASPVTAIAVPNALVPAGGVNDVIWVNPNDLNVKAVEIRRSDESTTPVNLTLTEFSNPGTLFGGTTLYYAAAWHPDAVGPFLPPGGYGDPSLRTFGGLRGFHYRSGISSISVELDNYGVQVEVSATTGTPVTDQGTYILLRAQNPDFSDATVVDRIKPPAPLATYTLTDAPVGAPVPGDAVPDLSAPVITTQVNPLSQYVDSTSVTNGVFYTYYLRNYDYSDDVRTTGRSVVFDDATDRVQLANHGFGDGDEVVFSSVSSGITTIYAGDVYVVQNATTNDFQLSLLDGSPVLAWVSNGTGTLADDESIFSTEVSTAVEAKQLLGSSPPSDVTGLEGVNLGTSIILTWNANPESNIDHYEVRWAYSLADLAGSPTVIDVGITTSYILSGFTPIDNVYVQVFAVDDGLDETGAPKTPDESVDSEIYKREVFQSNITSAFTSQIDEGNEVSFIWGNVQNVDHFELEIDALPSFNTPNKVSVDRFLNVEDLVLVLSKQDLAPRRSYEVGWYWRVRAVYPGDVNGLWSTEIRTPLTLDGVVPKQLGLDDEGNRLSNVPFEAVFISDTVTVTSLNGLTSYIPNVDFTFTAPDQIARTPASAIGDGDVVVVAGEFEKTFKIGKSRRVESCEVLTSTLDPLYYASGSKTTNIYKWFDAICKGALDPYLVDQGRLYQGRFINKTDPAELYERWGGMVALIDGEIPIPDAFAAISGLFPAFLSAGTLNAIDRACLALTGASCTIRQGGSGADSGWILYGTEGPPATLPEYYFSDLDPIPSGGYAITLADFDDLYNWNITIRNAARGVQKKVVRNNTGDLTDLLGQGDIVAGSVRIIDDGDNLVDPARYSVDHVDPPGNS